MGFEPMMATELEFYLFENAYESLRDSLLKHGAVRDLQPISAYNEDYHIFQTTKEEEVMRAVRNGLYGAGIPVEYSKGEADAGQEEVNFNYSDALDTADNHTIIKNGVKEIAWTKGRSVTFMAKYDHRRAGSSSHVHQSLWTLDGKPAFRDAEDKHGMSAADEALPRGSACPCARKSPPSWRPTSTATSASAWACSPPPRRSGPPTTAPQASASAARAPRRVRVECRIGGADVNPYLAWRPCWRRGLTGSRRRWSWSPK